MSRLVEIKIWVNWGMVHCAEIEACVKSTYLQRVKSTYAGRFISLFLDFAARKRNILPRPVNVNIEVDRNMFY